MELDELYDSMARHNVNSAVRQSGSIFQTFFREPHIGPLGLYRQTHDNKLVFGRLLEAWGLSMFALLLYTPDPSKMFKTRLLMRNDKIEAREATAAEIIAATEANPTIQRFLDWG